MPAVVRSKSYEPPRRGTSRHMATYALDPMRALTLATLREAVRGFDGADVPSEAQIQISWGQALYATWEVPDA